MHLVRLAVQFDGLDRTSTANTPEVLQYVRYAFRTDEEYSRPRFKDPLIRLGTAYLGTRSCIRGM